jgi:phosphoglycolate phosphatase
MAVVGAKPERVIAFDFDGVIADSLDAYYPVFLSCCEELGFQGPQTMEKFLDVFDVNAVKGLLKAGVPFYKLKRLGRALAPRVAELNGRIQPFPGIPALVTSLREMHPVYVVTSNVTDATRSFMERHGMGAVVDVIGSDREASKVKKLRGIRKRYPGAELWYVGDTKGDMLEARSAKAIPVAACWGWHERARLEDGKPDHLVGGPAELASLLGVGKV